MCTYSWSLIWTLGIRIKSSCFPKAWALQKLGFLNNCIYLITIRKKDAWMWLDNFLWVEYTTGILSQIKYDYPNKTLHLWDMLIFPPWKGAWTGLCIPLFPELMQGFDIWHCGESWSTHYISHWGFSVDELS